MPSASAHSEVTSRTALNARTSRRRRATLSRSRKRFEVSLASPSGPWPSLSDAARSSFFFVCCCRGLGFKFVEEAAAHWVAGRRDVALGEHDLEKMRAPAGGAEHLRAAVEVHPPDAAEALVEAARVNSADLVPVAVEALAPPIERERVVPAQVIDVEDFQPRLLHLHDHVGEAGNPAAGEDVLADEVVGLEVADMADEVDEA